MTTLSTLVDEFALRLWMQTNVRGEDAPVTIQRIGEGHSNLTFLVKRGTDEFVLRRPPLPPYLPTAHDVIREWRVINGLKNSRVPVPEPIAACEDNNVIGAPFYMMRRVEGYVIRGELPSEFDNDKSRLEISRELVRAMAELHSVDYHKVGLANLGKPEGYIARQLKRWNGQLEGAYTRDLPDLIWVSEWLKEHLPDSPPSTLVHGDYRLDNVIIGKGQPASIIAILDWELATLGDPLADVGYLLSFWSNPGDPPIPFNLEMGQISVQPGFMNRHQAVEYYAELTSTKVGNLNFYVALAIWKLAIVLEGSYKRHKLGITDDPFFATLDEGVPALAKRARGVCEGAPI
ncbi:phosphotransferase family protein [Candidatus Chlorohelix sp.]|uniref:phosphotransferase family protein n=1 Tax=Candidatus Chlorohelix sp. TaxID=3139201 RepID=UPI003050AFF8